MMNDVQQLPTGTVTMVFTDIEGSTALVSRLGRAYVEALDAMRATLRSAWSAHGGVEMGTEGDSFFVVFESAPQAVAAVVQAQRDLGSLDWPDGEDLTVRMGVHSGTPMVHAESYAGMDVHRAARIAAAAHGGQTLLSAAVKELVALDLPEGSDLVDLGQHQLKDIALPEHLGAILDSPPPHG
jgi:class 3 adenylate cyclase